MIHYEVFDATFHGSRSDIDNSGYVSDYELQDLFREASYSLPGYRVREIMDAFSKGDSNKDERISFEEFVSVSSRRARLETSQDAGVFVPPKHALSLCRSTRS